MEWKKVGANRWVAKRRGRDIVITRSSMSLAYKRSGNQQAADGFYATLADAKAAKNRRRTRPIRKGSTTVTTIGGTRVKRAGSKWGVYRASGSLVASYLTKEAAERKALQVG